MYGISSKTSGFTLLEVVVALVILSVSLTALIQIQTNYISKNTQNIEKIRGLKPLKEYIYNIPVKEKESQYIVKEKKEPYQFNIYRITYQLYKNNKLILEMYKYEKYEKE